MITYNREQILNNYDYIYNQRQKIENIADDIVLKGFDHLFFTSPGGSYAMMEPFVFFIKYLSNIQATGMLAADYLCLGNNDITKDSVAFISSKSGDSQETIDAVHKLKEKGVRIVGVFGKENSILQDLSDDYIIYKDGRPQELVFFLLIFRILNKKGFFPKYEQFANELKGFGLDLCDARELADEKCLEYSKKACQVGYNIWIGSGELWPVTYAYAMCVLEESQWLQTKSVKSSEFFHGTVELIEKDTFVSLVLAEGPTRSQDERVKNFLSKYNENYTCFDSKDYPTPHISNEFRWIVSIALMNAVLQRISKNIEVINNHDLTIRRFYRTVKY